MESRRPAIPVISGSDYVVVDLLLPLFNCLLAVVMGTVLLRLGCPFLGGGMVVCALGPYAGAVLLKTTKDWLSRQLGVTPGNQIYGVQSSVCIVPNCFVTKLHDGLAIPSTSQVLRESGDILGSFHSALQLVMCTLWALPVLVPYLIVHDAIAMSTVGLNILQTSKLSFVNNRYSSVSNVDGHESSGSNSEAWDKSARAQGWLFKRRFLELFFQTIPQVAVQLAILRTLEANNLILGTWPSILWLLSGLFCLCALLANTLLVIGFAGATGMTIAEILWFATDNPGAEARLSDTIVFLYRDQCQVLEINVDDSRLHDIWESLLRILRMDLENLNTIYVFAKCTDGREGVRKGLKNLFDVVRGKQRSKVQEVQVDMSVLHGFVQV